MLKKTFAILICLACLTACAAAEGLPGLEPLPDLVPSILPADELTLAAFGSDMTLELHFTGERLEASADTEGYARLVLDFNIANFDLVDYDLNENVSAQLTYDGTYVYEAACAFEQPVIGMLIETPGSLTFELPGAVAADGGDRLVLTLTLADTVGSVYVDVSGQAAALGFAAVAADAAQGLSIRMMSERIYAEWDGQRQDGLRYLTVELELFNNSDATYTVADALSASISYQLLYTYPARIRTARPTLAPMETQTAVLLFELPYMVVKDDDAASVLTVLVEGQPQDIGFRMSQAVPPLHAYRFFREWKTWLDAEAACEAMGGHLAVITSQAENDLVESLFENDYAWYGGFKDEQYVFHWVTGEPFEYTHWRSGEPSSSSEMYLGSYYNKEWNDYSGTSSTLTGYVCEWEDAALCPYEDCATMDADSACLQADPEFRFDELTAREGLQCRTASVRAFQSHAEGSNANYRRLIVDLAVINRGAAEAALEGTLQAVLSFRTRYTFDPVITYSGAVLAPLTVGSARLAFDVPAMVLNGKDEEVVLSLTVNGEPADSGFRISECKAASHAYSQIRQASSWDAAKAACEAMGGYLVTITSAEEEAFVETLFRVNDHPWYGGYADMERVWHWVTDEPFEYTNWGSSEPNNSGGSEDCLDTYSGTYWNDSSRTTEKTFICEWDDVSLVPEDVAYKPFP